MRTKNRRADMGTWFLLMVLLISSTESLEKIVCEKPSPPENGAVYLTDNSQDVGSQIEYICDEHHIMEPIASKFAICTVHGHWSSPQPRCIKIRKVRARRIIAENSYVLDNIELILLCDKVYEKYAAGGSDPQGLLKCIQTALYLVSPEHRPQRCDIITAIDNGHFRNRGKVLVTGEKIHSGTYIQLKCFEGYELYNKMNSMYLDLEQTDIKCYQGSFTTEIPSCEPKRCFMRPPINLEYFIGQEKVLENYIHSGTKMNAQCSNGTELFRFSSYLERENVSVKCNLGKLDPGSLVCKDKRCKITAINNGHFLNRGIVVVPGEKIQSGTYIKLRCFEGYELYNKTNSMYLKLTETDIKCYQGSFNTEIPSCEPKRCFIEPTTNLEYFIQQKKVLENYIDSGIVMNARCSNRTELFGSSSYFEREQVYVRCNLGKLEPESPVCKDKRCNIIATINNGHFINSGKVVVKGEKILSGSNIKLICFEGYELYDKTNSMYLDLEQTDIQCYQGSFTSETSSCEPKRCFIEPTTNLEYFIGQKKVLENYIDSGIVMNARCSNRTELFVSSSYLEREQVYVRCNLGKLEPESPVCKDKRCNITQIQNGKLVNGENVINPSDMIGSNSNITLVCYDGFELYNESISMYLESEKTDILCYQGSFNVAYLKCNPKRCQIDRSLFLLPEVHYVEHGQNFTVHCPDKMELHLEGNYQKLEETSVFCSKGIWTPTLPMCIKKMCKTIDVAREITGFIVSETKTTPGEFVHHNQSIQIVCGEGYRPHGILKCNAGIWIGNSTCELGCVLKDPGMHFISLGKRTVLNVGENANVSCKFGYQIVSNTSATPADQYDYDVSEVSDGNYTCRDSGKWEPEIRFSCKQMCQTIDVAREITGFIVSETKTTPGEFVPHNQSIETVCGEGYRRHGVLTCNAGIWMGNSTCEPDVTGCVLKDPGMHFISLGNRTVLKVGENAKVSCKFGYQIVPIISAKGSYEYNYPDSESTADPSEMQETEDNENLITVSDGNYTCIDNGKWKPELRFSCTQMCKTIDLTREISGFIVSETKTKPGEFVPHNQSIQIVCGEGYRPHGILTCNAGIWMGNSTCELGCVLKDPGMHFISLGNRTVLNVGENANVSCKFGYQIVSNTSATPADQYDYDASEVSYGNYTCRDSGKWEPEIRFSCKQMCQTIDVAREITGFIVSETKTTPGEFVPHNQSIETVCGEGYRRHGVLTCNAGIWMGNSTCEPDVTGCVLKDPGMHFISLGNRTVLKVGENAKVSCKFGYQIVPIISAKGSYEFHYPDSESTADPSEMQETEDNENLITVSDGNYTCIDNGKWEPEIRFSCTQIMCDSFDKYNLENGNIIYSTHAVDTVGTVVSFQCHPGYTRHGPETRTCQIDGTWSGQCVTCQRDRRNASITCPAPCVPEGARKTGSFTYEIGSIVKFYCTRSKTQDRDDRHNIRQCIKNGKHASWNGTKINCKEIICDKGDHYGFENGRVTYSSSVATVGTEASFVCNPGYNRHGPMTRICQKNGTWSGECVTCQKHQPNSSTCPAPCIPDGAIRIGSLSYEIGSIIQLYCVQSNMNYNVQNSYIIHCVNDGKSASWNGTNINCKAKCEPLTDTYKVVKTGVLPRILSDKTVVELNCKGSLPKVQAECRNGYWHPKKPTCKHTCSLSAVEGTLYNYKVTKDQVFQSPIKSDRQIKVTCKDGFLPNTKNYDVSRCVNGVWIPEIVKCEKTDNF